MSAAVRLLVEAVADAWSHPWDSFTSALKRVDDAAAAWQPPAYADAPADDGAAPGSILWHVAHVADSKEHYADAIERRPTCPPDRPPRAIGSIAAEIARAHSVHARFAALIAALVDGDLDATVREELPLSRFVQVALRHELWHAGQIRLVRRLYESRTIAAAG